MVVVVGLGRASLPTNRGLGAEGPTFPPCRVSDFGGLFLFESPQIEVEPPQTDEPPKPVAQSDVSPEGVVG